jgi:pimeloyl-ACP methyl ester carboxylesterase
LLVIHDRADREVPFVHGERLAALWPEAELHAPTGLGHRRILRDPAVIADAVRFIQDGVRPPASELVREVDRLLDANP